MSAAAPPTLPRSREQASQTEGFHTPDGYYPRSALSYFVLAGNNRRSRGTQTYTTCRRSSDNLMIPFETHSFSQNAVLQDEPVTVTSPDVLFPCTGWSCWQLFTERPPLVPLGTVCHKCQRPKPAVVTFPEQHSRASSSSGFLSGSSS